MKLLPKILALVLPVYFVPEMNLRIRKKCNTIEKFEKSIAFDKKLDDFRISVIRRKVCEFHFRNEISTPEQFLKVVHEDCTVI